MTNKKILTLITLLLFLLLMVGCDVIKPNQPPVITSDPVETATVGVDYTYDVDATDPNTGDVLTYSLTTEPLGMVINGTNGVITWKADDITTAGVGDYDVVVMVKDEDGLSDSQDFTITVGEFVVELVGIEVVPEEMTLCLSQECIDEDFDIGTFEVTAHYNDEDTKVVTSVCVYGISDTSIAKVDKVTGKVTALKVGTATISISYTEGDVTKEATLTVIGKGTINIHWLEDAIRYNPDNSIKQTWQNDPIPPDEYGLATLIKTPGGYYFDDVKDFYNIYALPNTEGSVVITETGLLSGNATYTLYELFTENNFVGQVKIVVDEKGTSGTMVGTYTQYKYAYADSEGDLVNLNKWYPKAVKCGDKWFVEYTDYIAHEWDEALIE